MRKFLISIISIFIGFSAYCAGENVTTSKSYVDSALVPKQDIIEGTNDSPRVLTNTGTAGEYGTKEIYNSTNAYGTQQDALIDAATMNAAVQNAIDSEFQCIEWVDNDPTKDCLLMDVFGSTVNGGTTLPSGYTQLEYIESTGTQWIDTGIKITSSDIIETEFKNSVSLQSGALYGVYKAGESSVFYANRTYYAYDKNNTVVNTRISINTQWHTTIHNFVNGTLQLDDTVVNFRPFAFANNITSRLFSRYYNSYGYNFIGAIRKHKITRNGVVILDLVAAQDSSGNVGMYDMVSRTFFANAGTGEFVAGPVINLYLPTGQ